MRNQVWIPRDTGTNFIFHNSQLRGDRGVNCHHRLTQISPLFYRGGIGPYQLRKVVPPQRVPLLPLVLRREGAQRHVPPEHLVVVALPGGRHLRAEPARPPVRAQVAAHRDPVLQHEAGQPGRGHDPEVGGLPNQLGHHEEPLHARDDDKVEPDPGGDDYALGPDSKAEFWLMKWLEFCLKIPFAEKNS